jgi:hypothetical protein
MIPKSGNRFSEKDHASNAKNWIMIDSMHVGRLEAKAAVATCAGGSPIAFPGAMLIFAFPIVVHAQS